MSMDVSEIYRQHAGFVWRSLRRLGVRGAATEDLMHDVFEIAHRRKATYAPDVAVTTWLFGIARRVAANYRRKATRAAAARPAPVPRCVTTTAPQEDALEHRRLAARIDEFLAQLSREKRVVFELVDIEGMSCPDVATALSIPLGQVYAHLRTARRRFEAFAATLAPAPTQEIG